MAVSVAGPSTPASLPSYSATTTLCHPVRAAKCISCWLTPFAIERRAALELSLPKSLVAGAYKVVADVLATNTKVTYVAGISRFTEFCDRHNVEEVARMPASPMLLTAFVAEHAGKVSGSTIRTWLSGVRAWHIHHGARWEGESEWVKLARITRKKEETAHSRPPRAPVSLEHLQELRKHLNISNSFHAALWATALVSFFGCRQLGKMTITRPSDFNELHHVLASTQVIFNMDPIHGPVSASFHIPWTKSTKQEGASVVLTAHLDDLDLCPVRALMNHLTINKDAPTMMSLFAYQNTNSQWMHMIKDTFLTCVQAVWDKAGLQAVHGHSFRIGGAVALLLQGVPPETVVATGGWTSLAFLLYWRCMEQIIPLHTSRAYAEFSHFNSLRPSFEDFCI